MNAAATATAPSNEKTEAAPTKAAKAQGSPQLTITPTKKDKPVASTKYAKLLEEKQKIEQQLAEMRDAEISDLRDSIKAQVEGSGFAFFEIFPELKPKEAKLVGAATNSGAEKRGSARAVKLKLDADRTGASPEAGKTYKLPDGEIWTKPAKGKSGGKAVAAAKQKTWAEMLVK